jgi:hypothetical protein
MTRRVWIACFLRLQTVHAANDLPHMDEQYQVRRLNTRLSGPVLADQLKSRLLATNRY